MKKWIIGGLAVLGLYLITRRPRVADLGGDTYQGAPIVVRPDGTRVAVRPDGSRIVVLDPIAIEGEV